MKSYCDGDVRCAKPESCLVSQHLLRFSDSSTQGQHEGCLIHQLALVLLVGQDPVNGFLYVMGKKANFVVVVFNLNECLDILEQQLAASQLGSSNFPQDELAQPKHNVKVSENKFDFPLQVSV